MIITHQTAYGFALLLLSAWIAGMLLSIIYSVTVSVPAIVYASRWHRTGYIGFRSYFYSFQLPKVTAVITDFLFCVSAASIICGLTFVFNSGLFRFSAVSTVCFGYITGNWLFGKLIKSVIGLIAFVLVRIIYYVSYPLILLVKLCFRLISGVVNKLTVHRKLYYMRKYTKKRMDKLGEITEFGFVDQWYKDLKNERTD